MQILLLADIHGNYPALRAIDTFFSHTSFDAIVNCGDSVVFAPFSNQVINWLIARDTISILGNTDKKVIKLLQGRTFTKPSSEEKRIMYFHAARQLTRTCSDYLQSLGNSAEIQITSSHYDTKGHKRNTLGIFHGSPARPHEFLFDTTPIERFRELAEEFPYKAIVTGHSHTPYHLEVNGTHFINPGSAGRMFDGNPAVGCAVLTCPDSHLEVRHYRIEYDVSQVVDELERQQLPQIYQTMYREGKKLN